MRALDSGRQRRQDRKCAPRRQAGARVGTVSALALPSPSRRLSGSNPHPVETGRVSEASGDTVGDVSRTLTWGLTFLTSCVLTATGPGSGSLKSPSPNPSRKPLSSFPSCPRLGLAIAQASQGWPGSVEHCRQRPTLGATVLLRTRTEVASQWALAQHATSSRERVQPAIPCRHSRRKGTVFAHENLLSHPLPV